MPEPVEVLVPLINPNEPEAKVATVHVVEGQRVAAGEVLFTLETTKATAEVTAERAGYVVALTAEPGDVLRAGTRLFWLAETPDWEPPQEAVLAKVPPSEASLPENLRITAPARALAEQAGLDPRELPIGPLITESTVRQLIEKGSAPGFVVPTGPFDPRALAIYGGGGHGKSLIDLVLALGAYDLAAVIDDGLPAGTEVMGLKVLGGAEALSGLIERGVRLMVNAVGGVGDMMSRVRVFQRVLEAGFACPTLVHPMALVEPTARLADGVQVFSYAYVGSEAEVGFGAIVNTGAVVSHDCRLGAYVNVAPGALLAGGVEVGGGALIGMGVTINLNVVIGRGARVGNSAVVKRDVPAGAVVQAGAVWPS